MSFVRYRVFTFMGFVFNPAELTSAEGEGGETAEASFCSPCYCVHPTSGSREDVGHSEVVRSDVNT